jgi:hypothetical protein
MTIRVNKEHLLIVNIGGKHLNKSLTLNDSFRFLWDKASW